MWLSRNFADLVLRRIDNFEERVEKLEKLEKRLDELEQQIQSQPKKLAESIAQEMAEGLEKIMQNCSH